MHRRAAAIVTGLLLVSGLVTLGAAPAPAHALAQSSDPPAGSTVAQGPPVVTVIFGEQPDPRLSSLRVLDASGVDHARGKTTPVVGNALGLEVAVGALETGVYTVAWRTVSSVDGHLAEGTFAFGVGVAPGAGQARSGRSVTSPRPSPGSVAGRWLVYAGLMTLLGWLIFDLAVVTLRNDAVAGAAWLAASAGPLVIAGDAAGGAHLTATAAWHSSIGAQLLGRGAPVLIAGALLLVRRAAGDHDGARRASSLLACVAVLAAMWGDVSASHASAAHSWRLLRMAAQLAHFAAAGVWFGGLVALLVVVPRLEGNARVTALRRFSGVALGAVAVIAASGLQRAYDEAGTLHDLFASGFGQAVLVKSALFAVLLLLGWLNRYRLVARAATAVGALKRAVRGEVALVACVLAATGVLQGLVPPTTVPAAPKPLTLVANDFATTVRVSLSVSPATAGFNQFTARVVDFDTHRPISGSVALRFALPARPDLGTAPLALTPAGPGLFRASSANLSIDGVWTVVAVVASGATSVEVPFVVATRVPAPTLTVQAEPSGLPTVYTLAFVGGTSIQIYLDPAKAAVLNEFHATFLGADGQEVAMASLAVTSNPGGTLAVRRLDAAGHFVADLPGAREGSYRFTLDAVTAAGGSVRGVVTIPVR